MTYSPYTPTRPPARLLYTEEPDDFDRRMGLLDTGMRAKLLDFEPFDPAASPGMPDMDRLGRQLQQARDTWSALHPPAMPTPVPVRGPRRDPAPGESLEDYLDDPSNYPARAAPQAAPQPGALDNLGETGDDFLRAAANDLTFQNADRMAARLESLTGFGGARGDYEGNLARERAATEAAKARSPSATDMASHLADAYGLSRFLRLAPRAAALAPRILPWLRK